MKLRVPPGPARAEVMQLVDVFRARVVDVSEKTLTVAVTGDAGKVSSCSLHISDVFKRVRGNEWEGLKMHVWSVCGVATWLCLVDVAS